MYKNDIGSMKIDDKYLMHVIRRTMLEKGFVSYDDCIESCLECLEKETKELERERKESDYIEWFRYGFAKGFAIGWSEARYECAQRMKNCGLAPEYISKILGMSLDKTLEL